MTIAFLSRIIISAGTLISGLYFYLRAANHDVRRAHKALAVLWCLLCAVFYAADPLEIPKTLMRVGYCFASIIFIWRLLKVDFKVASSAFLLSYGISNSVYYTSGILLGTVFAPLLSPRYSEETHIDYNEPVYLLTYSLIVLLQFLLIWLFFRIKRFRNGFPFLFKRHAVIISLIALGVILTMIARAAAPRDSHDDYIFIFYTAGIIVTGAGIIVWIRRGIKMTQRRRTRERNEDMLREEADALRRELARQSEINDALRAANHSINHRLSAMERVVVKTLEKGKRYDLPAEFSEELGIALEEIRKLAGEYTAEVSRVKEDKRLPSANIKMIDELFAMFAARFAQNDIDFKLKISGSIIHMTENAIPRGKLETLIGDHLQDALAAVTAGGGSVRCVMALLGEAGDCYEFSVHDSGVPFGIETLTRLGAEHVTTHAGAGGSGAGFMRTFETMRECGASLIVRENRPGGAFTKSITVRFDGGNTYIIETYRPGAFPPSDRYAVAGIQ